MFFFKLMILSYNKGHWSTNLLVENDISLITYKNVNFRLVLR